MQVCTTDGAVSYALVSAGMDDHLSKPLTRERLAAVLERWIPAR
jgi:hypothetical protein